MSNATAAHEIWDDITEKAMGWLDWSPFIVEWREMLRWLTLELLYFITADIRRKGSNTPSFVLCFFYFFVLFFFSCHIL